MSDEINNPIDVKISSKKNVSKPTYETHYKNDNEKIGAALILNYMNFKDKEMIRKGTEYDGERITNVLNSYGFEVIIKNDLTMQATQKILSEVAEGDHSKNDCLLVVIMSHGNQNSILTYDNFMPIENFWNPFLGKKCKSLINKPKIFIVQSCRGKTSHLLKSNSSDNSVNEYVLNVDQADSRKFFIPSTADLFLFFSTFEGYLANRDPKCGSWFIQSLCELLEKSLAEQEEFDLTQIATKLNGVIVHEFYENLQKKHTSYIERNQMPNFASTLTKTFIVRPRKNMFI